MPQMSPMSSMLIYVYFITTFLMFIVQNYFTKKLTIKQKMNSMKVNYENFWNDKFILHFWTINSIIKYTT